MFRPPSKTPLEDVNIRNNGKFLPSTSRKKDSLLVSLVKAIISKTYPANNAPIFKFENTPEAEDFNSTILSHYNYDINRAIRAKSNTILHPGSEFRPIRDLQPLLKFHIDWPKLEPILSEGVRYSFANDLIYKTSTKRDDLLSALKKGNNNSANEPSAKNSIINNYSKEVAQAWMIPFRQESILKIMGASVIPIGIAKQWTMNSEGERIRKLRTTHDLSRPWKSGNSVNNMIDKDLMDPCLFGFCLSRLLHGIHAMRHRHPKIPIFISKIDLDSAFRRIHVFLQHALLSFTIVKSITYFLGRLPFGAADAPSKHDTPSNIAVDLSQALIDDPTWDPEQVNSPQASKIPPIKRLDATSTYGNAFPLAVTIPNRDCFTDGYIDDLMSIALDTIDATSRARHAIALSIHTIFRPININDPLPRNDVLSERKLLAESRLEEIKTVLGWVINTRSFRISLPNVKAQRWTLDINDVLNKIQTKQPIKTKEWQSLLGKLNNAAYIFREGRFFLSRLRYELHLSELKGMKGQSFGSKRVSLDLELWNTMIKILHEKGRSINHSTITYPHLFSKSDASCDGLGGYTCFGIGWRFIIPYLFRRIIHINILEFLAITVTTWLSIYYLDIKEGNGIKILGQSDNTSTLGWLKAQTRYDKNNHISSVLREYIGRKLAHILIESDVSLFSQHIKGSSNDVADALSRSPNASNDLILNKIQANWKHQLPPNGLHIIELPQPIFSFIQSVLEKQILMMGLPKEEQKKFKEVLKNGQRSQNVATWTYTSAELKKRDKLRYSVVSRTASDITSLAKQLAMNLEEQQFAPKSSIYLRPSPRMDTTTLFATEMEA